MVLLFVFSDAFSDACEKELAPQLPSPTATKASQATAKDLPVTFMSATDLEWQVDSLTGALCFRVMQSERELHDFKKKNHTSGAGAYPVPIRACDPIYMHVTQQQ